MINRFLYSLGKSFNIQYNKTFIFPILLFFALISCENSTVYKSSINYESGWHKDSIAVFEVMLTDTAQVMDFILTFSHIDKYRYNNFWIFASVENFESKTLHTDTIELFMAYPDGSWFGKKKGENFEISTYYKHAVKIMHPGNYRFEFRQGMRIENLEEMNNVSFKIIKR